MNSPNFPAWLERVLIANGTMTETGLFRNAHPKRCHRCHTWTLAGLDADLAALEIHADPARLNAEGEAWALIEGRATFELAGINRKYRLEPRTDPGQIIRNPPKRHIVLAQHKCNNPVPAQYQHREEPRLVDQSEIAKF